MKRLVFILLSFAAVIACSKTEVNYDRAEAEIAVIPMADNLTKAAVEFTYPEDNHIAMFAFHSPTVGATESLTDYSSFTERYLYGAEFYKNGTTWSGLKSSYYWPIMGSLVFAGYSLQAPSDAALASNPAAESPKIGTSVSYDLQSDKMEIEGYVQSNLTSETFDLLYFGRTANSTNNRRDGEPITLTFRHSLSWITVKVKSGTGAAGWKVIDAKFEGVDTKGNFTYDGLATDEKVEWDDLSTPLDVDFYTPASGAELVLSTTAQPLETVTGGTLVLPQAVKSLKVTVRYDTPAEDTIDEVIPIDLTENGGAAAWAPNKHYIYELTFSPMEIKVAPTIDTWE